MSRGGLYDSGIEPDPRFTLANERTFLAWCRTSVGLLAAALAADAFLDESAEPWKTAVACAFGLLGALCALAGFSRWRATEAALRQERPLPRFVLALPIAGGLGVVFALASIGILVSSSGG